MRLLLFTICLLIFSNAGFAAVDMGLRGKDPVRLEDVYQQNGTPYVAIEDAIDVVGLQGHWNSIEHTFRIKTRRGWAELSPASSYLKIGEDFYPLKDKPRFIDGRLRVTDSFVLNQLAQLVGQPVFFRNLDPNTDTIPKEEESNLEQLFSFLLNRKPVESGPLIRAVAIDPGHGGLDTGVLSASGVKEKELTLVFAEKLARQLKMKLGIPVYLSRDGDYEATMEQRLENASRDDVDIWILLHSQAAFSPEVNGVTLFIRPEAETGADSETLDATDIPPSDSLQLASDIALSMENIEVPVQGIYPSSRLSLGQGNLPTVLIELGYMSHPAELDKLQDAEYQGHLVEAIFQGVRHYAMKIKEQQNDGK